MTENLNEPTYGVESSDGSNSYYYLGHDETLWDWANAPISVPFVDSLAEVPLPVGYFVMDGIDRIVKGSPASGITTTLISEKNAYDDKAYILTCSMVRVPIRVFNAAGLSDERILRSVVF